MEECYALHRKSVLTPDEVMGDCTSLRAISGFVKKTTTATAWTQFAFSLPLRPGLAPPLRDSNSHWQHVMRQSADDSSVYKGLSNDIA